MFRWLAFMAWTVLILYSMDFFNPSESAMAGRIARWFASHGLPECLPAKMVHWSMFFGWTLLLAGALDGRYRRPLSRRHLRLCLAALAVFSALPEALQCLNPARTPAVWDVCINFFGGAMGLGVRGAIGRLGRSACPPAKP